MNSVKRVNCQLYRV